MFARRQFVLMAALVAFAGSAVAAEWPERPVKIFFHTLLEAPEMRLPG